MLPTRGTWTGWENGPAGTSCIPTTDVTSCAWAGITPRTSTGWEAGPQRRTWGSWGTSTPWAAMCPCSKGGQQPPGLHQAEQCWERWFLPSPQHWRDTPGRLGAMLYFRAQDRLTGVCPAKGYKEDERAWSIWECSAWKRESQGDLTHMFKHLTGE